MKKRIFIWISLVFLTLGVVVGFLLKKPTFDVPQGKVLVSQEFLDSLNYIANLPPTIIVRDTIIKDTVRILVHTYPQPIPDTENEKLLVYTDSLVIPDTIDVQVRFKTTGLLEGPIEWSYTPIFHLRETVIERFVPYPVIQRIPFNVYRTGYYLSFVAGGNENMFLYGIDFDIVRNNSYIYGINYRRLGDQNIYGIKFGIRLNSLFNLR